ncbi:MFS transporter [Microbacterium sp. MYb45]|uniref:MFS transporter n=1 Tax=Microbacterium sp. MYb45 TaxID=1827294 RepID=UPI000D0036F3|nr:MFS transporter [Microbacterium sp. MYb45]PRB60653.1 MFS transporter [Microbacterium sp. MYb45]
MDLRKKTLLAAICAVAVATVYAAQPVLAQMGRDLQLPTDALGWLVSVGQLGYLVGLVLLVPLGDRFDRRRLIALHLGLVAVGMLAVALAPAAGVAFAGLTLTGIFAVVVQTTVAYAAAVSDPGERGRNLGFVTSGVVVGILGSRLIAGMMADLWGWRSIYVLLAALSLLLGAAALRLLPVDVRPPSRHHSVLVGGIGRLLTEPAFLSRGVIAFFLFASFGTLWSGMALPLSDTPWELSETQIGLFGLAGLTGALGAVRAGHWADGGKANRVTGLALVALVASWVLIAQLPWSLMLLIVGIVVLDFAVQAVHVSNQHTLTTLHPDRVSTTIGGYMIFYSLGSAVGAVTTTVSFSAWGWAGSSILGAVFAAAALVAWGLGLPFVRKPRSGEPDSARHSGPITQRG